MTERPPDTGLPRWVKVSLITAGTVVLLLVALLAFGGGPGGHGPGRHLSEGTTVPSLRPDTSYAAPDGGGRS